MVLYRLGILLGAVVVLAGAGDAQLPPAMQMDLHAVEAERHIETGDYAAAKAALDRVLALQAAHDVALPEAFWFKHAQVARQAGLYAEAIESVTRYLTMAGREGAHYRAALELLDRARIEGEEAARRRAAEQQRAEEVGRVLAAMEFVLIEAGTFAMGSPATEEGRNDDEGPVHQVTLSQPFSLGKYEVTQGQWAAVMGHKPSQFPACGPTCPVDEVSWTGRAGVHCRAEPVGGRGDVPLTDRSGVGVCGAGGDTDGNLHRRPDASGAASCAGLGPDCVVWREQRGLVRRGCRLFGLARETVYLLPVRPPSGGAKAAESVGAVRYAGERVGVDGRFVWGVFPGLGH